MPPFGVSAGLARLADARRSGSSTAAAAGGRLGAAPSLHAAASPAGAGASAISSPACGGSARPSWSRPTSSPGRCRSACSACRRCSRSSPPSASPSRGCSGRRRGRGSSRFAFGLTVSEWLRGHLFTGFPWNTLGMALGQNLWLMQAASRRRALRPDAPGRPDRRRAGDRSAPARRRGARWTAPGSPLGLSSLMAAFGAWRVPAAPGADRRRA